MAEMGNLTEEMVKAGVVLMAGGLQPSPAGTRITYSGGKSPVIDGPFAETKELIGGFALVKAKSKAGALELARRVAELHIKAGIEGELEIRPLFGSAELESAQP
ncbi:MAG: YciI family protein [Isosphaeraceae bacterium]|nr:YciI family protein [Isosphaeraceae bacterium]